MSCNTKIAESNNSNKISPSCLFLNLQKNLRQYFLSIVQGHILPDERDGIWPNVLQPAKSRGQHRIFQSQDKHIQSKLA